MAYSSTFVVALVAALALAANAADPVTFEGYAVDVACVQNTGSQSFDKGVSVLANPEEHTKYCLMMSVCIKDLVLIAPPAAPDAKKCTLAGLVFQTCEPFCANKGGEVEQCKMDCETRRQDQTKLHCPDYALQYGLDADLLADVAAQITASTKAVNITVKVEGCPTGATKDVTPGGGTKQTIPVLGKCGPAVDTGTGTGTEGLAVAAAANAEFAFTDSACTEGKTAWGEFTLLAKSEPCTQYWVMAGRAALFQKSVRNASKGTVTIETYKENTCSEYADTAVSMGWSEREMCDGFLKGTCAAVPTPWNLPAGGMAKGINFATVTAEQLALSHYAFCLESGTNTVTPTSANPCEAKKCGDTCSNCVPGQLCLPVLTACQADGKCTAGQPTCTKTVAPALTTGAVDTTGARATVQGGGVTTAGTTGADLDAQIALLETLAVSACVEDENYVAATCTAATAQVAAAKKAKTAAEEDSAAACATVSAAAATLLGVVAAMMM